jgi:glycosyltransferase involved in cell wall biosynthesis
MKLLQLGQASIVHPATGAQLRNYHLAKELAKSMDVTHLGFTDATRNPLHRPEPCLINNIPTTLIQKNASYTVGKLLKGTIGRLPADLLNFESASMSSALSKLLDADHYDIIQIEGVELFAHLKNVMHIARRPRLVVWDWHNIESELMYRYSQYAATPLHQLYLRRTAKQLRVLERELLSSCDLHLVTSERERRKLSLINGKAQIVIVENGVAAGQFDVQRGDLQDQAISERRDRVLFVGSMDYHPNADAVRYFCNEMWPSLHQQIPQSTFSIVGRNPPSKVSNLKHLPGVEVTGTVDDVRPYYKRAFVVVVPLRLGGGTRLKILEAMAAGVPVVSTSCGAEGLRAQPMKHIEIADSPLQFILQVKRLWHDREHRENLSRAGRTLIETYYDWTTIGARLRERYDQLSRSVIQCAVSQLS